MEQNTTPQEGSTAQVERTLNASSAIRFDNRYLSLTKTVGYSYLFVLPLIILYEIGVRLVNAGNAFQVRIGADVLIKRVLSFTGLDGTLFFAGIIVLVGAFVFLVERRRGLVLVPRYFLFMLAESAAYAVLCGMVVSAIVSQLFSLQIPPNTVETGPPVGFMRDLVLSLGAGIYEELLFRLVLVTLLFAMLKKLTGNDRYRYTVAAIVGALIFSWVHYVGVLGDVFTLQSFTYRFLMGLALNALFLLRGFGIAAMTHALYDVYVTVLRHMGDNY